MRLRGLVDEDFVNYKKPAMFLITSFCDFKCCREAGNSICQNLGVMDQPLIEMDDDKLIERYRSNSITQAIVIGGLEPFDTFEEVYNLIHKLRWEYNDFSEVVIYTGYYPEEIVDKLSMLSKFDRIIVKFGRFIPDQESHYDEILGIRLASDNQ